MITEENLEFVEKQMSHKQLVAEVVNLGRFSVMAHLSEIKATIH